MPRNNYQGFRVLLCLLCPIDKSYLSHNNYQEYEVLYLQKDAIKIADTFQLLKSKT